VIDDRWGEPVTSALVEYQEVGQGGDLGFDGGSVRTDERGRFALQLARAGRYVVQVRIAGQPILFAQTFAPAPSIELRVRLPADFID